MKETAKPLTAEMLRGMILQVLEDFELLMPLSTDRNEAAPRLPAEPEHNEDPPNLITEELGSLINRLKKLEPEKQRRIAKGLGFHALDDVVAFIHRLMKAIKGK